MAFSKIEVTLIPVCGKHSRVTDIERAKTTIYNGKRKARQRVNAVALRKLHRFYSIVGVVLRCSVSMRAHASARQADERTVIEQLLQAQQAHAAKV